MRKGRFEKEKSVVDKKKITRKNIIVLLIWLIIAIFIIYQLIGLILYTFGMKEKQEVWLYNKVCNIMDNIKKPDIVEDYTVKFAGLGDIYFTPNMIKGAKEGTDYNFIKGTDDVVNKLKNYDVVIANLNTPIADSSLGYSSKNVYNAPLSSVDLLKELNISAVASATYHAFDKKQEGIINTISNLENSGIEQVGINNKTRKNPIVITKNNISIGLLSYTTSSNVKISKDIKYMVNMFDEEILKEDISYLKSQNVDFIISYLSTKSENTEMVNSEQKRITEKLFESGVDVVLGVGNMVVQESIQDIDEKDNRKIYAIYSLGDFCGGYQSDENCLSIIANIDFKKQVSKDNKGDIISTQVSMEINKPIALWTVVDNTYKKNIYLLEDEISNYELDKSIISQKEYQKMKSANEKISSLFVN